MQLRSALHRASGGLAGLLMAIVLMSPSSLRAQPSEEARYTMMFRSVDLHEALERVVETTHINLVYDSELVQGKTVYCSARDVRPDALLRCLLVNVPVDFYQTSGGTYVLKESPRRPPDAATSQESSWTEKRGSLFRTPTFSSPRRTRVWQATKSAASSCPT